MTPRFSIIIPVYNVAPYLRECLDSVVAAAERLEVEGGRLEVEQRNLKNSSTTVQPSTSNLQPDLVEIICVDDGSTDGSGAILDEYASKDSRFKVIHQANAGVSAARNAALDLATGEWLTFVDGDDRLREDGLVQFAALVEDRTLDGILVSPYIPAWKPPEIPVRKIETKVVVDDATKEDLIFGQYAANGFVISRFYRREMFGHLRFGLGIKMAEDVCFWFDALCIPAKWKIVNAEYYLYRQRPDSVCGKKDVHDCAAVLDSVIHAMDRISKNMALGDEGARRYVERWPYSPWEYLGIFTKKRNQLTAEECAHVLSKKRSMISRIGYWPFVDRRLKTDIWLIEHHLGMMMPLFHSVLWVRNSFRRGIRFLDHLRNRGLRFAFGKLMRMVLGRGEYAKS